MFEEGTGVWLRARHGKTSLRDGEGLDAPVKEIGGKPVWFENKDALAFEFDHEVAALPSKQAPPVDERKKLWEEALRTSKERREGKEAERAQLEEQRKRRREEKTGVRMKDRSDEEAPGFRGSSVGPALGPSQGGQSGRGASSPPGPQPGTAGKPPAEGGTGVRTPGGRVKE